MATFTYVVCGDGIRRRAVRLHHARAPGRGGLWTEDVPVVAEYRNVDPCSLDNGEYLHGINYYLTLDGRLVRHEWWDERYPGDEAGGEWLEVVHPKVAVYDFGRFGRKLPPEIGPRHDAPGLYQEWVSDPGPDGYHAWRDQFRRAERNPDEYFAWVRGGLRAPGDGGPVTADVSAYASTPEAGAGDGPGAPPLRLDDAAQTVSLGGKEYPIKDEQLYRAYSVIVKADGDCIASGELGGGRFDRRLKRNLPPEVWETVGRKGGHGGGHFLKPAYRTPDDGRK
jgi:hypothetical protein